ncbi:hypothetical protein BSZ39_01845 [Bowdeniella nasicola]|uniref:Methyltransferase type 11 domain-containing protein n=1 Tax=Bowdeniella nasicola TaxID=208480 RepID=A0A1Q5Q4V9_9ACTO|nr:class I SAM-dependent methyltransferase [Bowdeniella nasicola]OKL54846.1 hypothetical protein BSZ39_01845 [Bowdeniella nasicola]
MGDEFFGYRPLAAGSHLTHEYWDRGARDYADEHVDFLTRNRLIWGPEGWDEADVQWLGTPEDLAGLRVLEVGCGLAQGARYLASLGAHVVGIDIAPGMLGEAHRIDAELGRAPLPLLAADACALPLADQVVDLAFSAFGAIAFVPDVAPLYAEVARVLRPGGRWVFSAPHPMRWVFSDDPVDVEPELIRSYFDRTPYLEGHGDQVSYAEFHHTLEDHVAALAASGFVIESLREPQFAPGVETTWGGWSAERSRLFPGTMVVQARRR